MKQKKSKLSQYKDNFIVSLITGIIVNILAHFTLPSVSPFDILAHPSIDFAQFSFPLPLFLLIFITIFIATVIVEKIPY